MIVQCELCSTRFKLDDAKVKDEGVRVRCSKCRHIFVVRKEREEPPDDTDFDSFLNGLVTSGPQASNFLAEEFPDSSEKTISNSLSVDSNSEIPEEETSFHTLVSDPFAFDSVPEMNATDSMTNGNNPGSGFDNNDAESFNDDYSSPADIPGQIPAAEDNQEPSDNETFSFSDSFDNDQNTDSIFGAASPFESTTLNPEHNESVAADELQDTTQQDVTTGESKSEELKADALGGVSWDTTFPDSPPNIPESFSSSDNSIKEPDVQKKSDLPVDSKGSWDIADSSADEPTPPFLTTRKLSGSKLPLVLTVISVLSAIVLAVAGLYMLNNGPGVLDKLGIGGLAKLVVSENAESGGISLRNTSSEFMSNSAVGELFVIKGEALNTNSRPIASIQLKASIYNSKGVLLLNRMVYCGNSLSKEQLTSLPMNKMEAVMGNQFGDSLSNLGLQPGKAIPFVAVFSFVPKDAAEFGLEVVGSTSSGANK